MNRQHLRPVFNAGHGVCKAMRLVLVAAAVPGLGLLGLAGVKAQMVVDPTAPGQRRPTVLSAPNGVPLVNIQTPSAAGVSHNVYRQFDVQGHGAILNNSRGNVQTQTGGWVQGNPWLAKGEARVILNEVNSSDPSQLRGALEVAGGRAEVIVANPAGIQVDGARFINASRVTLTTGSPVVNGGSLDGYRVQRGTVRIDGAGLDASLTDHAAILARAVQVNAGVWAQQLQVVSGANEVSADLARVSPSQAQGEAPRFALDVAQLGGMYAGQIHLIGTEAGVGVNLAGSVGATAADLIIDTSGWLSSTGRLQAQGQLHVSAAGDLAHSGQMTSAQAMQLSTQGVLHNSGQVDSMQGLEVQAQAGVVNGGRMASRDRLRVQTPAGLRNSGELVAGGELVLRADTIGNQNGLASARRLDLQATALDNAGGRLEQSGAQRLDIVVGELHVGVGGRIGAPPAPTASPAPQLAPASVPPAAAATEGGAAAPAPPSPAATAAASSAEPTPEPGRLHITGRADNADGQVLANGPVALTVGDGPRGELVNQGVVAVDQLVVRGQALDNRAGQLRANTVDIQVSGGVDNRAGTIGAQDLSLMGDHLDNRQGRLLAAQRLSVNTLSTLDNAGGVVYGGAGAEVQAATVDNTARGLLASGGDLRLRAQALRNATGTVAAGVDDEGHWLAGGSLWLGGPLQTVDNQAGELLSAGSLRVEAGLLDNRQKGLVGAGGDALLGLGRLDNSTGTLVAGLGADGQLRDTTDLLLSVAGELRNASGALQAGRHLRVDAQAIDNQGGLMQAGQALDLRADALDNRHTQGPGQGIAGQRVGMAVHQLANQQGRVRAGADLDILSGGLVDNSGGLLSAGGRLRIADAANPPAAPGALGLDTLAAAPAAALAAPSTLAIANAGGTLIANQALSVQAAGIGLNGQLLSPGDMALLLQGDHAIAPGGKVIANGDLTLQIQGGGLVNAGLLQAGHDLSVSAENLTNEAEGEIASGGQTTLVVAQDLVNRGLIDGVSTRIDAGRLTNTGAGRVYGDRIGLRADALVNEGTAVVAARDRLDLGVDTLLNRDDATLLSAGDMAVGGALDENGRATGRARLIHNLGATIESLGDMHLGADVLQNSNGGFGYRLVPGAPVRDVRLLHNGIEYTPDQIGTNFGGLTQYADRPDWAVLLPGHDFPFSRFPAQVGAWAVPEGGAFEIAYTYTTILSCSECDFEWRLNYPSTHGIWALMGVTAPPPAPPIPLDCFQDGMSCGDNEWSAYHAYQRALPVYQAAMRDAAQALNARIDAYNQSVRARRLRDWTVLDLTRTTYTPEVTHTDPGRLLVGGDLTAQVSQSATNDKSQVIVGGLASLSGANWQNIGAQVQGRVESRGQSVFSYYSEDCGLCNDDRLYLFGAYAADQAFTTTLATADFRTQVAPVRTGVSAGALGPVGTGAVATGPGALIAPGAPQAPGAGAQPQALPPAALAPVGLPTSALFRVAPGNHAPYLVETDPRFTNQRLWFGSDYLLRALALDPATTQKRLGDAFYEQQLVREQVAALTGQRYLGDHRNDEDQYRALMNGGATTAQALGLRPGIALSAEQVAQLTSDIVWLVERAVALPDGSTTTALVPQVYLVPRDGDLQPNGALLAARDLNLQLGGELLNTGTIAARRLAVIEAGDVNNLGGRIGAQTLGISAQNDIRNLGGTLRAQDTLVLDAGRDLEVRSTTQSTQTQAGPNTFTRTAVDRQAVVYVGDGSSNGVLLARAGQDMRLDGALVRSDGDLRLQALRELSLGTVRTEASDQANWNATNHLGRRQSAEEGTQISAGGDAELSAGQNLVARAASVQAGGELALTARQDVRIEAGQASQAWDEAHQIQSSGTLSRKTVTTRDGGSQTDALGSALGGQRVLIQAGQDIVLQGSSAIGDQGVALQAGRDVALLAQETQASSSHFQEVRKSGVGASGSVSIGKSRQSIDQQERVTGALGSTVGSIAGELSIEAGRLYQQVGSEVLAPGGDIAVSAQAIAIEDARTRRTLEVEQKSKSSGVSVGVGGALVEAAQTTLAMAQAVRQTGDARFKALGVAAAGLSVANNSAEIAQAAKALQDGDLGGAFSVNVSVGSSQSQSHTRVSEDRAQGSTLAAGGEVLLRAQGEGAQSDIVVRGSQVKAGGALRLQAEGDIAVLAAQDHRQEESHQSSKSTSVGASIGASGVSANLSVSRGSGNGQGEDTTQRNSHISGQRVELDSGADTTVRGAVVTGTSVQAEVGGDLTIQSLQDSSRYSERQRSSGASVSVPVTGGKFSGSVSGGRSKVDANFDSVGEQSAIRAGDGGFQVAVQGQTELKGGAITSTQVAVDAQVNRFSSESGLSTSDIRNEASYQASGHSVSAGVGGGKPTGSAGVGSDSGHASSTSSAGISGISGIAGNTAARTGDAETGIAPIFDKDKVKAEVQAQVAITAEFGKQASRAVGDYAAGQLQEAEKNGDQAGIDAWGEGGSSRVALHALVGGLTGGASGAVGAAAASVAAPAFDELQGEIKTALNNAGVSDSAAKLIASLAGGATAATIGGASGGTTGAATAFNADMNNRQLHPSERKLAQELAKKSGGRYTAEEIEEQMRLMGYQVSGEQPNTTAVVVGGQKVQDSAMPVVSDGIAVVEVPGQANMVLQQFIIGNTKEGADYIPGVSPYVVSNPALSRPVTGSRSNEPPTATCANGDTACITGIGRQQNAPLTQQTKEAIADGAALISRQAGVIGAAATASTAVAPPQIKSITSSVAAGATAVSVAADAVEQMARPNIGVAATNAVGTIVQTAAEQIPGGKMVTPVTNEFVEIWKGSGSALSFQEWINTRLGSGK